MKFRSKTLALSTLSLAIALGVAGCSKEPAADDVPLTVHEAMTKHVDLVADEVWAVGNEAISNDALLDPAKMNDAEWTKLADAATRLQSAANQLGSIEKYVVNRPGVVISDENVEGGSTSAKVQQNIDADISGFRSLAAALATHASDIASAAKAKDTARAGQLINGLDGVCESCHLEFWYPQQRELVESILKDAGQTLPTT